MRSTVGASVCALGARGVLLMDIRREADNGGVYAAYSESVRGDTLAALLTKLRPRRQLVKYSNQQLTKPAKSLYRTSTA